MTTETKTEGKIRMTIKEAAAYIGALTGVITGYFSALGEVMFHAIDAVLKKRLGFWFGLAFAAGIIFQVYMAVQTAGGSLLYAPFAIALDTLVFGAAGFMVDASLNAIVAVGGLHVAMFKDWNNRRKVRNIHKEAETKRSGMGVAG